MPCAVRNLTELPLRFAPIGGSSSAAPGGGALDLLDASGVDVKPSGTVAFESEEQAEAQRQAEVTGGQMLAGRLATEATTSNCEELVGAARDGNKTLLFTLLERRANINSTAASLKAKCALHEACKRSLFDMVQVRHRRSSSGAEHALLC
jgi:hypothetical protein